MHLEISQEQLYTEIYRRNARAQNEPRTQTHTLCELAQSKCTWKFYKSHFIPKFKGKMPVPRVNPERGHTLCASLRSRNALGDFTRATLHEHLQVKAAVQEQAKLAPQILCEPAKSKCTWRFHKSHCMRKFAGKMPRPRMSTLIKPTERTPQCGRGNKNNNNYNIYSYNYTYNNINCNYS
jgi:hypothetical protein